MQLFMLYKAIQTVIEMGPIDALTGYSKNTIAEEKLLKMKIENRVMVNKISYIFDICIVYLNSQLKVILFVQKHRFLLLPLEIVEADERSAK